MTDEEALKVLQQPQWRDEANLPRALILALVKGADALKFRIKVKEELGEGLENSHEETMAITEVELGLLRLLVQGKSNKQIAPERGIAEQTVKNHLTKLYLKMAVANRTEAVIKAMKLGLIETPEKGEIR